MFFDHFIFMSELTFKFQSFYIWISNSFWQVQLMDTKLTWQSDCTNCREGIQMKHPELLFLQWPLFYWWRHSPQRLPFLLRPQFFASATTIYFSYLQKATSLMWPQFLGKYKGGLANQRCQDYCTAFGFHTQICKKQTLVTVTSSSTTSGEETENLVH